MTLDGKSGDHQSYLKKKKINPGVGGKCLDHISWDSVLKQKDIPVWNQVVVWLLGTAIPT